MTTLALLADGDRRAALEGNIGKCFAIMALFSSFSFAAPTIVLLWKDNGVSVPDGVLLQMIFTATMVIFDLPTGYLADVAGRKPTLVCSALMYCAGTAAYALAQSFNHFLVGEVALGLAISLASGADQALLYDTLKKLGRESEFAELWGRAKCLTFKLMAGSTIVGGLLAAQNLRLPLYITCIGGVLLLITALSVKECSSEETEKKANVREVLDLAKLALIDNRRVRWIMFGAAFISAALQGPFWLYQPYLEHTGVKVAYLGFLWAAFNLTAGWFSKNAVRLWGELDEKTLFFILLAGLTLGYGMSGLVVCSISGAFFLLLQGVRGSHDVLFSSKLHGEIEARRATQISLQSMLSRLSYLLVLLFVRELSSRAELTSSFVYIAAAVLGSGVFLFAVLYEEGDKA